MRMENFLALSVDMIGDSGPYASVGMKVLERAAGHASGPYVIPILRSRQLRREPIIQFAGHFEGLAQTRLNLLWKGSWTD